MIPKMIIDEIFDIEYKPTDVLIDHISDALEDEDFVVGDVANFDTSVYIDFTLPGLQVAKLSGTLIIHRMKKVFEVVCSLSFHKFGDKSVNYLGMTTSDFFEVERYIRFLRTDCRQYVEAVCIENKSYRWHGLRFKAPV